MKIPYEIIRKKRDGEVLNKNDIYSFISGAVEENISDAQISAFCMSVFFNDMNLEEKTYLTNAMIDSGEVISWNHLSGPVADKHSTGGIGDKVSLILAPIVASCGLFVPMIAGRGLGHTGGTIDKLESIPGYNTSLEETEFKNIVGDVGCAIIGQTNSLAPADKIFYAIRDVTATIESVPLITASILSKKIAAGISGLVMDIKTGNGAFATKKLFATEIAESIVTVSKKLGLKTSALITDMNQPLGSAIGNSVEVIEAVDFLIGNERDKRLNELVLEIAGDMLFNNGISDSIESGKTLAQKKLSEGYSAECFNRMVNELGGPSNFIKTYSNDLSVAGFKKDIKADKAGYIYDVDTLSVGRALTLVGGGRKKRGDKIDHSLGFIVNASVGDWVEKGQSFLTAYLKTEDQFSSINNYIKESYTISLKEPKPLPVIIEKIK